MTQKLVLSSILSITGGVILWIYVNPWALLGVFLFVWGNNISIGEKIKELLL